MSKMIFNCKKGKGNLLIILAIVAFIGFLLYIFSPELREGSLIGMVETVYESPRDILNAQINPTSEVGQRLVDSLGTLLGFVVGGIPSNMVSSSGNMSSLIVILCIWLMFVLVMGDIFRTTGVVSDSISFVVALLIGIAAANLKMIGGFAAILTQIFAGLGIFAVYAGLFASIVAFFVTEWGIEKFKPWIDRRKSMKESYKVKEATTLVGQGAEMLAKTGEKGRELGGKK